MPVMRRKPGTLVPLELAICQRALEMLGNGVREFHGYEIAKKLADDDQRKALTAYGTLYRALARLEDMGLLKSRWEDPEIPARENRPGRRLYTVTAEGERAVDSAPSATPERPRLRLRRRPATA